MVPKMSRRMLRTVDEILEEHPRGLPISQLAARTYEADPTFKDELRRHATNFTGWLRGQGYSIAVGAQSHDGVCRRRSTPAAGAARHTWPSSQLRDLRTQLTHGLPERTRPTAYKTEAQGDPLRVAQRHQRSSPNRLSGAPAAAWPAAPSSEQQQQQVRITTIDPRPLQQDYYDALMNDDVRVIVCLGVAGSGKTLCAVKAALDWLAREPSGQKQVQLTRPAVNAEGKRWNTDSLEELNEPAISAMKRWVGRGHDLDRTAWRRLLDESDKRRPRLRLMDWDKIRGES